MFKSQLGFTLIELMVTLVVLGILIAVGVPSFKNQISSNKAVALNADLVEALNFVRSEAIKQAQPAQAGASSRFVTLCASADGLKCSTNSDNWRYGFIAVVDFAATEDTNPPVLSINEGTPPTILKVWSASDANAFVNVRFFGTGTDTPFIRYTSTGKLAVRTNPATSVVIKTKMKDKTDSDCLAGSAQQIHISLVGMIHSKKIDCF